MLSVVKFALYTKQILLLSDYLQENVKGSVLYGFRGGPAGIMKCKYMELTSDYIHLYRNQVSLVSFISSRIIMSFSRLQSVKLQ